MIQYQVGYNLKILFVGINPHPGSDLRGVPFSNNKMFWYLLHDAGLIEESREVLRDEVAIKHLYLKKFKKIYGFGLLNVADRPTPKATDISRAEALFGSQRLQKAILKYTPQVVCFVGKITYDLFIGSSKVTYGWQPEIGVSKIYVMHAPHRGSAAVRIKELQEVYQATT